MTATLPQRPPALGRAQRRTSPLAAQLYPAMPADRLVGWLVALGVTFIAGILRFADLARPHAVVFDETYYMKDALSYLRFGYEHSTVEKANDIILAGNGDWRTIDVFGTGGPSFVVHPPVGKWTIALGEYLFGLTPFGWRFMPALLGTLAVLLTVRIGRRLTRSTLLGGVAGFLLAIDGMAISMSRTALLDGTLMFFVLAAFGAILLDRDRTRGRIAQRVLSFPSDVAAMATLGDGTGPRTGARPWRWAAGLMLGLACATKWSGIWFVVAFGLMTVVWDVGLRRVVGVRTSQAWLGSFFEGIYALVAIGGTAVVVYVASWVGWFRSDGGYDRHWAETNPAKGIWVHVPDAFRSLLHYHSEMLRFNTTLSSPHSYQSNAWSWLLQTRPTSFYYESFTQGQQGCTVDKCSAEVVALGNPFIWWGATVALIYLTWRWFTKRDWRAGAVVVAILAGWAPWLGFQGRTIFTFYSVAFVPFMCLALTLMLATWLGTAESPRRRKMVGTIAAGGYVLLCLAGTWFFYPIWTAETIPWVYWHIHMWFPTWV